MPSDSEDEDDYAFYGTGLEPIEEDAVPKKKPFALENQVVLDKQGKRRFHGAFTGGFTAGYCNTVGSSEGWIPSAFKSSRSEKATLQTQKPEDFMDDEDTGEFGIAPRVLRATADYRDQTSSRKRGYVPPADGPIPGKPVMMDLLKPSRETIGARLLRQMGWKPGQGVGPRLSHKEKKQQQRDIRSNKNKVYGCSLPSDCKHTGSDGDDSNIDDDDDDDHTYVTDVTFAPDDYDPYLVKPKIDRFGIGYSGLDKKPVLSSHVNLFEPSFLGMTEKKKKVAISGQAFGVGALEEDDEDIYARDDMSQYDYALETSASIAASKRAERDAENRRMLSSTSGSQGQALEGFAPAKHPLHCQRKFFPPPALPNDFVPTHSIRKSRFESSESSGTNESISRRQGLQRHELNATSRANILGEPVQKPAESAPVQKLEAPVSQKTEESSPVKKPADPVEIPASEAIIPQIKSEPVTPSSSSKSFRPFAENPQKQTRYEQFVDLCKRGLKDSFTALQPSSMTEWDKEQEKSEFEQAARIYKPLSGFMSDRFVSASQPDDSLNPLTSVEKTKHGPDELRGAAKMKMFGKLTRRITSWNPCALLCKRFNVPQPSHSVVPESKTKTRFSVFDYLDASAHNTSSSVPSENNSGDCEQVHEIKQEPIDEPSPPLQSTSGAASRAPTSPSAQPPTRPKSRWDCPYKTSQKDESPVARPARPNLIDIEFPEPPVKADLFKAIFLSSSEDSDSDAGDETSQGKSSKAQRDRSESESDSSNQPTSAKSIVRNMSPPRGIFANLDLDAINAKRASKVTEPPVRERSKSPSLSDKNDVEEDMMYGPKLPTNNPVTSRKSSLSVPCPPCPVRSEEKWVEKDSREKHRKHSKHKKEKKHKKHKSKKHKRKS